MDKLPSDFKIAIRIYRCNQRNEPTYFNKLVQDFEGKISRATVSKNLDQLLDLGIIAGDWQKSDNGKWIRTFKITDDVSSLISSLSEKYMDSE